MLAAAAPLRHSRGWRCLVVTCAHKLDGMLVVSSGVHSSSARIDSNDSGSNKVAASSFNTPLPARN